MAGGVDASVTKPTIRGAHLFRQPRQLVGIAFGNQLQILDGDRLQLLELAHPSVDGGGRPGEPCFDELANIGEAEQLWIALLTPFSKVGDELPVLSLEG